MKQLKEWAVSILIVLLGLCGVGLFVSAICFVGGKFLDLLPPMTAIWFFLITLGGLVISLLVTCAWAVKDARYNSKDKPNG